MLAADPAAPRALAVLRRLLVGLGLAELALFAALLPTRVASAWLWAPGPIGLAYLVAAVTLNRHSTAHRRATTVALVVGALHTTAIAVFMVLLTSFLGPVDSGGELRSRALVMTVIALVVIVALTTYTAIALLWSRAVSTTLRL